MISRAFGNPVNSTYRGLRPDPEDSDVCCCNKVNISEIKIPTKS